MNESNQKKVRREKNLKKEKCEMIKSGTCPYCGARYDMYHGCSANCPDSQVHAQLVEDATDGDPGEAGEIYLRNENKTKN